MDNFEEIEPVSQQGDDMEALYITEDVRSYLYESAKWTKFLAIVGFIFSGLIAMVAFSAPALINSLETLSPNNPLLKVGGAGLTVIYLLIALFQFYPSYLLYKFSSSTNQAVLFGDQASLSVAMRKLKSLFKFWGILTIIFIAFYAMVIILVAVVGVAVASR